MMTFTPTQKELFNKNIEALSNILLKESLKGLYKHTRERNFTF